ncbi:MAG TPA: hypothetical protein DCW90_03305 [Lachnospiraceae bacterium]|nr:hypothetical protein [Lachnospiraceae bacterium]
MESKNRWYKERFINALYKRDFTPIKRGDSYVVRCPFCGDSSNPKKAHLYITINLDDNTPILYNCFRCPAGGVMNRDVMEKLNLDDPELTNGIGVLNRTTERYDQKHINNEETILHFDYKIPELKESPKLDYIRSRLGYNFSLCDFEDMKVITSLKEFLKLNKLKKITCPDWVAYMYERDYVGFLSHGNSHILFRDITGKNQYAWVKYPITESSKRGKIFYTLSGAVDIFTKDEITINIGEGVFDVLGVYYHFFYGNKNTINLAVTGKYYMQALYYMISLGLCGYNVTVNIFSDNDEKFNQKRDKKRTTNDTSMDTYRELFKDIKYMFKTINIFYNEIGKDCGVPKDKISLIKHKI